MHFSTTYTEIGPNHDRETGHTYFFMMNSLLYSRMESGHPSNDQCYDEDVNVYLAGLLASLVEPIHHAVMSRSVVRYDDQLFARAESTGSSSGKYRLYRANADFLLISIGIFNNPRQMRPHAASPLNVPSDTYIGRGMAYYNLAQSYCRETYRRSTAVGLVLGKLSSGFEKYARILSLMRSEYLNLYRKITSGELYHLGAAVERTGNRGRLDTLYDEFLDAYSRHRRDPSYESKQALDDLASRIGEIDPAFRFDEGRREPAGPGPKSP